jgi:hypothetical protein
MLNSICIQSTRISMEAFYGANIKELLSGSFSPLVTEVKSFLHSFMPDTQGIVSTTKVSDFIRSINKHPYLDITPLAAFVPEGLDTTYLEYLESLMKNAAHASTVLNDVLSPYSVFLSQIVNNKDAILETTTFSNMYKSLEKERSSLYENIGKCFKYGSTKTEVTLGDVIKRNSDWEHVFNNVTSITKLINSVDRNILNKKIKECSDLLDIIIAKIKRNELNNATPEVVRNLSDGAYQVASELEFFSVTYYKIIALVTSIDRTTEHFNKIFGK